MYFCIKQSKSGFSRSSRQVFYIEVFGQWLAYSGCAQVGAPNERFASLG
jgi:hypothetical protein